MGSNPSSAIYFATFVILNSFLTFHWPGLVSYKMGLIAMSIPHRVVKSIKSDNISVPETVSVPQLLALTFHVQTMTNAIFLGLNIT